MMVRPIHKLAAAGLLATATALGSAATPAAAADPPAITGKGKFTFQEPGLEGHQITFGAQAGATAVDGSFGDFSFKHVLPSGEVVGEGVADITCAQVSNGVALLTAVVPEGQTPVRNHAFYVKIIDGQPDQVASVQAQGGDEPPPRDCMDFEVLMPGAAQRYPLDAGNFVLNNT
ncbi:hypothetical protein [Nocardia sp. CY41]|uniref:hypothetical protein n=1 Tax=Nocardia sp. CY41 TaxID=2608686 RepID=UPI001359216D|nr:hypothetical protein [Nocardia sp. CY41]